MIGVFADDVQTTSPYLNTASAYNASPALFQNIVNETRAAGKLALLVLGGQTSGDTIPWADACSPADQSTFINALVGAMQQIGADGINLDMEVDPHNTLSVTGSFTANSPTITGVSVSGAPAGLQNGGALSLAFRAEPPFSRAPGPGAGPSRASGCPSRCLRWDTASR